jgi:hypothetical protein
MGNRRYAEESTRESAGLEPGDFCKDVVNPDEVCVLCFGDI